MQKNLSVIPRSPQKFLQNVCVHVHVYGCMLTPTGVFIYLHKSKVNHLLL